MHCIYSITFTRAYHLTQFMTLNLRELAIFKPFYYITFMATYPLRPNLAPVQMICLWVHRVLDRCCNRNDASSVPAVIVLHCTSLVQVAIAKRVPLATKRKHTRLLARIIKTNWYQIYTSFSNIIVVYQFLFSYNDQHLTSSVPSWYQEI